MLTKHKIFRTNKRREWLRINKKLSEPFSKHYEKLSKYEKRKKKKKKKSLNSYEIIIPEKLDFEENIENMVEITKKIKKTFNFGRTPRFSINHKFIKSITTSGLLYLVGQISKLAKANNINLKYNEEIGLRKKDERIRYLFDKIGYWECFGISKAYTIDEKVKDNYFLSIQTNNKSDITLLNKIKKFIKKHVDFINSYDVEYKFDDAVKEAMANSIEHAYADDFNESGKEKGKWWICGHFDKVNNSLELVFYDYGMGIRKSIQRNLGQDAKIVLFDKVKDQLNSDATLIEIAINSELKKYKKYKEHDRGKGFGRFKKFAQVSGHDCEMTIVSDKGKFKYFYDGINRCEKVYKTTHSDIIEGMLIKWKITLNGKAN